MSEQWLRATEVSKSYGPVKALNGAQLGIAAGEILAFCGHNGAGKSTMVNVLSGLVRADEGTVTIDGAEAHFRNPRQAQQAGIALVDQEISLIGAISVEDNLHLGLSRRGGVRGASARKATRELLARVGLDSIDPRRPVSGLSLGQRQLIEIARALGRDARLLILDEPTATLTAVEIEHVFAAVRAAANAGTSVIFVSHRLGEVLELCDRVAVFRNGFLVDISPTAALDRGRLVDSMVGDVVEGHRDRRDEIGDRVAVRIRDLTVPARLSAFDLDVREGEIVALAGQLGSGASTVIRALGGMEVDCDGSVVAAGSRRLRLGSPLSAVRAGFRYVSNDRKEEGLFLKRTGSRNLISTRLGKLSRLGIVNRSKARSTGRELAEVAGVAANAERIVGNLSGGNQQKVFVGRALRHGKRGVLLLDEPSRGVDVAGRAEIHDLVRDAADRGDAVIFASTEFDEILDLADVVVTMFAGQIVARHEREYVSVKNLVEEMTYTEQAAGPALA